MNQTVWVEVGGNLEGLRSAWEYFYALLQLPIRYGFS